MPQLINWDIASHPLNWIKVGLMAMLFMLALEMLCQTIAPDADPSPNIMN